MTITKLEGGGFIIDGSSLGTARLLALAAAVKLEDRGIRRSGRSATAIARVTTGIPTRDRKVLVAALELMAEANERGRDCPLCKAAKSVIKLSPEQLAEQTDGTTHVCHPNLGGCNHGFAADDQCRVCGIRGSAITRYRDKVCGRCDIQFQKWFIDKTGWRPRRVVRESDGLISYDLDFTNPETAVAFDEWMSTRPTPV